MSIDRFRRLVPPQLRRGARSIVRLLTPSAAVVRKRGDPTSFGTVIDERLAWLHAHVPPEIARFQGDIYTKEGQRRLGKRLGLALPEVYLTNVPLAEALAYVAERGLEGFVVKPVSSHNAIGCRALVARGRGYFDLRSGRQRSLVDHARAIEHAYARLGRPDAWLVEELLLPADGTLRAIDDYKFYCIGGHAELIAAAHPLPRGKRIKQFYDHEWRPVNVGFDEREEPHCVAPVTGRKLVEFAEWTASRLAYPFIRLDLYDTTRGIVLGEFTPGPGRRHAFNQHWNDYLLRRWLEAEAKLLDGIRSSSITLLGPDSEGDGSTVGRSALQEVPGGGPHVDVQARFGSAHER